LIARLDYLWGAMVILIAGLIVFLARAWKNHEWPFGGPGESTVPAQISPAHQPEP
jgi:hypothetical protein